jgi:hypothetical protein
MRVALANGETLPELGGYAKLVDFLNETADIVTDDFTKYFILHGNLRLAARMTRNFALIIEKVGSAASSEIAAQRQVPEAFSRSAAP